MATVGEGWAELPEDLLFQLWQRLSSRDLLRAERACSSWRSALQRCQASLSTSLLAIAPSGSSVSRLLNVYARPALLDRT